MIGGVREAGSASDRTLVQVHIKYVTRPSGEAFPGVRPKVLALIKLLGVLPGREIAVHSASRFVLGAVQGAAVPGLAVEDGNRSCRRNEEFFLGMRRLRFFKYVARMFSKVRAWYQAGTAFSSVKSSSIQRELQTWKRPS